MKAFRRAGEKRIVNCKIDIYTCADAVNENQPDEKQLETASFVVHATRGVIRDRSTRRRVMTLVTVLAVVLVAAGFTILQKLLDPKQHPWLVVAFWLVCFWLTVTAVLLAVFDLITLRLEERRAERELREQLQRSTAKSE